MSQGSPYQYTAADIRRYVEGTMSPSEMHALEKAALDDQFLADAIEGFQASMPPAADVAGLKARLEERTSTARVVPIRPKPWLSVAAAAVVLLGMAYSMWVTLDPPKQATIAKAEQVQVEDVTTTDSIAEPPPPPPPATAVEKPAAPKAREEARPAPQPSPTLTATEPPVAINNATRAADEAKASEIVINKEEEAKRLRAAPLAAPKAATADKARRDESGARIYTEPADGWSAFEVYVMNNLRRPKDPVMHGNVVLSFHVNPETGKPYDIKVDKGLHPIYDKEAIRLLKEGPAWAVYNTEHAVKTTYTVVF